MRLFIFMWVFVVLAIGITVSAYADINDGVIAAWTFDDGKVRDAVGDAHGELFKAAKIVDQGRFGKALDVDGSKDTRAEVPFNPDLEASIEGPHTVSYWLYVRNGVDHAGVWKGEKVGWGANFTLEIGAGRQIGGNAGNDTFLDAIIDDIIIWDRALSEDEVQDLANGKRPDKALAVKAEGKLTTTWGGVKSYHHRR